MPSRQERLAAEALIAIQGVFASSPNRPFTASEMSEKTRLPRLRIQPIMEQLATQGKLNGHPGDGERVYIASRAWLKTLPIRTTA